MNRSELVRAVAERAGSDETVARRHVDAVVETVMERVSAGERVTVTGFGTFDSLSRPARSARNPRTGVPVEVPAAEVPRFRSGQTFRNRVAHGGSAPAEAPPAAEPAPPASDVALAEPPSPKTPKAAKAGKSAKSAKTGTKNAGDAAKNGKAGKNGKNRKKAEKGADAAKKTSKKTSKKAKAIKVDIPSPAKKTRKAKARAKAAK